MDVGPGLKSQLKPHRPITLVLITPHSSPTLVQAGLFGPSFFFFFLLSFHLPVCVYLLLFAFLMDYSTPNFVPLDTHFMPNGILAFYPSNRLCSAPVFFSKMNRLSPLFILEETSWLFRPFCPVTTAWDVFRCCHEGGLWIIRLRPDRLMWWTHTLMQQYRNSEYRPTISKCSW